MKIARFAVAVAVSLSCCTQLALAQTYPVKPVRVVIPWPPGGSNDIVGRLVMQKLRDTRIEPAPLRKASVRHAQGFRRRRAPERADRHVDRAPFVAGPFRERARRAG